MDYANRRSESSRRFVKNRAGATVPNIAYKNRAKNLKNNAHNLRPAIQSVPKVNYHLGSPNITLPPGSYSFGLIPENKCNSYISEGFDVASQGPNGITAGKMPGNGKPFACRTSGELVTSIDSDGSTPIGIYPTGHQDEDSINLSAGGRVALQGDYLIVYDDKDNIIIEALLREEASD